MRSTLRESKQFEPILELEDGLDNEFILLSPNRVSLNSKDQIIRDMEQRNKKIEHEIEKVQRILYSSPSKTQYGVRIPESSYESTHLELENAYKHIRTYEYEVKKIKKLQASTNYVDQVKKLQRILKEKEELSSKLRKNLISMKKESASITNKLKDNQTKDMYTNKAQTLMKEDEFLRDKVTELEKRKQKNLKNFQHQGLFIIKLERELKIQGMHEQEIKRMKQKYTGDNLSQSSYYKLGDSRKNAMMNQRNKSKTHRLREQEIDEDQTMFVEDRTPQAFRLLINEITILKKLVKDYDGQLRVADAEKKEACNINAQSMNRLLEIEDQIDRIEQKIIQRKGEIDPRNMRPQRALSIQINHKRYSQVNRSLTDIKSSFAPLFKSYQVGQLSKSGKRFSDRLKLGKSKAKIIGIDLFQNKMGLRNIVGIQATYQILNSKKKSAINMVHDSKMTTRKMCLLEEKGDYFKYIQCVVQRNVIIGISFISAHGYQFKGGCFDGTKKEINISESEYPTCFYGSFGGEGMELFGCQVLEQ